MAFTHVSGHLPAAVPLLLSPQVLEDVGVRLGMNPFIQDGGISKQPHCGF